jgi:HJR/Mrr/RecB family endonuclease
LLAALGVLARSVVRMAPGMQLRLGRRPDWRLMLNDVDYFQQAMLKLFAARGYQVHGLWLHQDPLDETPREVIIALERGGTRYAALCVRWIIPVTSDVIGRFEKSLPATQADIGMIATTSIFTEGALERARGLRVELYDRNELQKWIALAWP